MILVIDNYDSFVYNLARYVQRFGTPCTVVRNDAITMDDIKQIAPQAIIISPGPCAPAQAGRSVEIIKRFGKTIPFLGVCLGHQAIGEAYGGKTVQAVNPMHGKNSVITHDNSALFQNIPNPMQGGRYHSLITQLPKQSDLIITARSDENEIMAMQHNHYPVYGVQFHPESILTQHGAALLENFLNIANTFKTTQQTGIHIS